MLIYMVSVLYSCANKLCIGDMVICIIMVPSPNTFTTPFSLVLMVIICRC